MRVWWQPIYLLAFGTASIVGASEASSFLWAVLGGAAIGAAIVMVGVNIVQR